MHKRTLKSGFTLVEIMIVVAIIALLAAIAIPNLLRAKVSANDALAKATVRSISTAAEAFATANSGNYPTAMTDLTAPASGPAYLNTDYNCAAGAPGAALSGYQYQCDFLASGYTIAATPETANSGSMTVTVTTGGVMVQS